MIKWRRGFILSTGTMMGVNIINFKIIVMMFGR